MSEMVERVARAIYEIMDGVPFEDDWVEIGHTMAFEVARAAIKAMRQPTEAMTDAGDALHIHDISNADDQWRAMVDEALK